VLLGSALVKAAPRMLMKLTPGINICNILQAAFMQEDREDPKIEKRRSSHRCLFALLGSACVKAASKTLVKLTPGLNLTSIL